MVVFAAAAMMLDSDTARERVETKARNHCIERCCVRASRDRPTLDFPLVTSEHADTSCVCQTLVLDFASDTMIPVSTTTS